MLGDTLVTRTAVHAAAVVLVTQVVVAAQQRHTGIALEHTSMTLGLSKLSTSVAFDSDSSDSDSGLTSE